MWISVSTTPAVLPHGAFSAGERCDDRQPHGPEPAANRSRHARRFPRFPTLPGEWERGEQSPGVHRSVVNRLQEKLISGKPHGASNEGQQEEAIRPAPAPAEGPSSHPVGAPRSPTASLRTSFTWKSRMLSPNSSSLGLHASPAIQNAGHTDPPQSSGGRRAGVGTGL